MGLNVQLIGLFSFKWFDLVREETASLPRTITDCLWDLLRLARGHHSSSLGSENFILSRERERLSSITLSPHQLPVLLQLKLIKTARLILIGRPKSKTTLLCSFVASCASWPLSSQCNFVHSRSSSSPDLCRSLHLARALDALLRP